MASVGNSKARQMERVTLEAASSSLSLYWLEMVGVKLCVGRQSGAENAPVTVRWQDSLYYSFTLGFSPIANNLPFGGIDTPVLFKFFMFLF